MLYNLTLPSLPDESHVLARKKGSSHEESRGGQERSRIGRFVWLDSSFRLPLQLPSTARQGTGGDPLRNNLPTLAGYAFFWRFS